MDQVLAVRRYLQGLVETLVAPVFQANVLGPLGGPKSGGLVVARTVGQWMNGELQYRPKSSGEATAAQMCESVSCLTFSLSLKTLMCQVSLCLRLCSVRGFLHRIGSCTPCLVTFIQTNPSSAHTVD